MTNESNVLRPKFTDPRSEQEGSVALLDAAGKRVTFDRDACRLSDGREAVVVKYETEIASPNGHGTFTNEWTLTILTELGETLYACKLGDFVTTVARAVMTHAHHHIRDPKTYFAGSRYDVDTIKLVLRTVKKHKMNKVRGYCEAAAIELNELGHRTVSNEEWTSGSVGHLWHRYKTKFRVHVRRQQDNHDDNVTIDVEPVSAPPSSDNEPIHRPAHMPPSSLDAEKDMAARIAGLAMSVSRYVEMQHRHVCAPLTPPDGFTLVEIEDLEAIRLKASKWDRYVALIKDIPGQVVAD